MIITIEENGNAVIIKEDMLTGDKITYLDTREQFDIDFGISIPETIKQLSYEPDMGIYHIVMEDGTIKVYESPDENSYMSLIAMNLGNIERRLIELNGAE
jgi:hypothetical protein